MLRNRGYDDEVLAAALLHDAVEDTSTTLDELSERFGPRVCALVAALSEDPAIAGYEERKAALREQVAAAGEDVAAIYAADKVAKARELRALVARGDTPLEHPAFPQRRAPYGASLGMLDRRLARHPLVQQLRCELWALRALPPTSP